jgi:hypothetical protein
MILKLPIYGLVSMTQLFVLARRKRTREPGYNATMILRRRRLWFVLLVGLALAGGVWVWAGSTALRCKHAERIKEGMTRDQVHQILGRGPDWEKTDGVTLIETWYASDGQIWVYFTPDKVARSRNIVEVGFIQYQWARLRYRLGI